MTTRRRRPQRPFREALAVAERLLEQGREAEGCELLVGISDELLKAGTAARAERLYGKLGPRLDEILYEQLRRPVGR